MNQTTLLSLVHYPNKKFELKNLIETYIKLLNIHSQKGYFLNLKGIYKNY